jgi:hypothetical protein
MMTIEEFLAPKKTLPIKSSEPASDLVSADLDAIQEALDIWDRSTNGRPGVRILLNGLASEFWGRALDAPSAVRWHELKPLVMRVIA